MSKSTDSHEPLTTLDEFGTDPGSLQSYTYIPKNFPKNGPLVVVLHGSTQSAESYDSGSGWSALADECGDMVARRIVSSTRLCAEPPHLRAPGQRSRSGMAVAI